MSLITHARYIRGQMAPGLVQQQQQGLTEGGMRIDQLRLALANQQAYQDVAFQALRNQGFNVGGRSGPPPTGTNPAGAQNASASSGGIQNGPQGTVSAQAAGDMGSLFEPSTAGALEQWARSHGQPVDTAMQTWVSVLADAATRLQAAAMERPADRPVH